MSGTTHGTTWLQRTSVSTRYVSSLAWKYWDAFQVRGERQKLRAALFDLSDRELMDIGIARDEIDYIASHRVLTCYPDNSATARSSVHHYQR